MKQIFKFAIHLVLLFIILYITRPVILYSQEGDAGQPGAFLKLGIGARAVGMGRTFTAIANDASAAYWNPAGLGTVKLTKVMGTYAILSMERRHNYAAIALPIRSLGTIGVSWINLDVGEIEGRDLMGRMTGTFSNAENAYFISWGFPVNHSIHLGCSAKYITHSLENYQSSGYGFDAGIFFQISDIFSVGGIVRDISTNVKWNTISNLQETYPISTRIGASISPSNFPMTIGMDYEQIQNRKASLHAGLEFSLISGLGVRIGYDNGHFATGGFISFPLGNNYFQTDYSFGEDPIDRTYVHRISISISFSHHKYYEIKNIYTLDGRVIRVIEKYPNYALINVGSLDGIKEGMIFNLYRLQNGNNEENFYNVLIGKVMTVKVKDIASAVRIINIDDNYIISVGDVLILDNDNEN